MEQAIIDFKNLVLALIDALPPSDTPQYWAIVGGLSALLALLLLSLLTRKRNVERYGSAIRPDVSQVTFDDAGVGKGKANPLDGTGKAEPLMDAVPAARAGNANAGAATGAPSAGPDLDSSSPSGFQFFKRKSKTEAAAEAESGAVGVEEDAYLVDIEKRMLAARQQYLDGQISKQVYVEQTRDLYEKAKARMT